MVAPGRFEYSRIRARSLANSKLHPTSHRTMLRTFLIAGALRAAVYPFREPAGARLLLPGGSMKSAAVRRIAAWLGGVAAVAIGVTLATGSAWAQTIGEIGRASCRERVYSSV